MTRFSAFLDACVLVPPTLNDVLLRIAETQIVNVRWSRDVLREVEGVLVRNGLDEGKARRRLEQMDAAFPFASVEGYERLATVMTNDPKDRHVLAAAAHSGAQVLVTFNVRDFSDDSLRDLDLHVLHPDVFLLEQLDLYPGAVIGALRRQAKDYRRPAMTVDDILSRLVRTGLPDFADEARRHL